MACRWDLRFTSPPVRDSSNRKNSELLSAAAQILRGTMQELRLQATHHTRHGLELCRTEGSPNSPRHLVKCHRSLQPAVTALDLICWWKGVFCTKKHRSSGLACSKVPPHTLWASHCFLLEIHSDAICHFLSCEARVAGQGQETVTTRKLHKYSPCLHPHPRPSPPSHTPHCALGPHSCVLHASLGSPSLFCTPSYTSLPLLQPPAHWSPVLGLL